MLSHFSLPVTLPLLPSSSRPRRLGTTPRSTTSSARRGHKLDRAPPRRRPGRLPLLGHRLPRPPQPIAKRPVRERAGIPHVRGQRGGVLFHGTCIRRRLSGAPAPASSWCCQVDKREQLVRQRGVAEGGGLFQLGVEVGSLLFQLQKLLKFFTGGGGRAGRGGGWRAGRWRGRDVEVGDGWEGEVVEEGAVG